MASPLRTVDSTAELERELSRFPGTGRSILLVGGADFADCTAEVLEAVRGFLAALARVCDAAGAAVVDGGTDSGVMRWFAEARAAVGGTFPLVGVAPQGAFTRETRTGARITPAKGHSLILAVPGERFGDEQDRLFEVVDRLGAGAPTVVVNGGRLARIEARQRLEDGYPVLVLAGSGRTADALAEDEDLRASGRLRVIPLGVDEPALAAALEEAWTR
jgi:hypothetical protein